MQSMTGMGLILSAHTHKNIPYSKGLINKKGRVTKMNNFMTKIASDQSYRRTKASVYQGTAFA